MNTYRFMSCNVRLQMDHDGINQFYNRAEFLGKTLEEIRPDVIGFQELTCAMRLTLMKHLPSYFIAGGGRDASRLDESPAIAFLKDRFLLEQLSTEILSMTPHIPGTTYGGDQSIRRETLPFPERPHRSCRLTGPDVRLHADAPGPLPRQ